MDNDFIIISQLFYEYFPNFLSTIKFIADVFWFCWSLHILNGRVRFLSTFLKFYQYSHCCLSNLSKSLIPIGSIIGQIRRGWHSIMQMPENPRTANAASFAVISNGAPRGPCLVHAEWIASTDYSILICIYILNAPLRSPKGSIEAFSSYSNYKCTSLFSADEIYAVNFL